jgi:hypothetical protein
MPTDVEHQTSRKDQPVASYDDYQKRRWLRDVLRQLGTPEAKAVLRQLDAWTADQWPRL